MQRRNNKKFSSPVRTSRQDDGEEEGASVIDDDEEEEQPQSKGKAKSSPGSKSRGSSKSKSKKNRSKKSSKAERASSFSSVAEEDDDDEEQVNLTGKPPKTVTKKVSSKKVFEFRNNRLGAAFSPSFVETELIPDDEEDNDEEEVRRGDDEDENFVRLSWEEEDPAGSPPPEEDSKKIVRSGNNNDSKHRCSSSSSKVNRRGSGSRESFRKKSYSPSYYPQKRPSFSEPANSVELFEDNNSSYDAESSPPESSNTSLSRPLGIMSSSMRLPQIYDLRPSIGGYNQPPPRLNSNGSSSRDVTALPIEIPENVTDEAAFRRYLAVRRGAFVADSPFVSLVDVNSNSSSYESVGGGFAPKLPAQVALMQQTLMAQIEGNKRTMTLSYAIMTLALLSASATQLRVLVAYSKAHAYSILNYFLVCLCIAIELVVGLGYVILSRFTSLSEQRVDSIHNYLISGLFVVAVANVIIAAFAFDDHVCEVLAKQTELFDTVDQSPQQTVLQ